MLEAKRRFRVAAQVSTYHRGRGTTLARMERSCARPTCKSPAAATLTYDYHRQTMWMDHLSVEEHPMQHDLCLHHADVTGPPQGWEHDDRRGQFHQGIFPISRAS